MSDNETILHVADLLRDAVRFRHPADGKHVECDFTFPAEWCDLVEKVLRTSAQDAVQPFDVMDTIDPDYAASFEREKCQLCGSSNGHSLSCVKIQRDHIDAEPAQDAPDQEALQAAWAEGYEFGLNSRDKTPGDIEPLLKDPVAVHINMLRGSIAKPSWEAIKHLYPEHFQSEATQHSEGDRCALPTRDAIAGIIRDKVDYFLADTQGPLEAADAILAALSSTERR